MASPTKAEPCPRCKSVVDNFIAVDTGLRVALKEAGSTENPPERVCASCYDQLTSSMSQGLKLRMERDVREKNKMMMWKNRVHLIKNARGLMAQKAYSEAAVQYEKYLRVLELVYNLKKGELSPSLFNNSSRSKELTVVASVYWDLVRIYDQSPRFGDRMQSSASKLAEFLPYSPIFPDIMKKAEAFSKTAKNQAVIKNFLRTTRSKRGPCFVADAAFIEQPEAVELHILRAYRDRKLRASKAGRIAIYTYYRLSPPLAAWIRRSPSRKQAARWILTKIADQAKKSLISGR